MNKKSMPRYVRVISYIEEQIDSGRWQQNEQIPPEEQLCKQFSYARGTIRQAINELVAKGVLYRIHGKGTFVCPEKFKAEIGSSFFRSFLEEFVDKGFSFNTESQYHEIITPDSYILSLFNAQSNEKFLRVCRVRSNNNVRFMYSENHIQLSRFPGFDELDYSKGLYTTLEQYYGVSFKSVVYNIEAIGANKTVAEKLNISEGSPVLLATQIEYDETHNCLDVAYNWIRSDIVKLSTMHAIER